MLSVVPREGQPPSESPSQALAKENRLWYSLCQRLITSSVSRCADDASQLPR